MVSRRAYLGGRDPVALLVVVVVLPVQLAVLHEDGEASSKSSTTNEHALCAAFQYVYFSRNRVVHVFSVRRRALTDANGAGRIQEMRHAPDMARVQ